MLVARLDGVGHFVETVPCICIGYMLAVTEKWPRSCLGVLSVGQPGHAVRVTALTAEPYLSPFATFATKCVQKVILSNTDSMADIFRGGRSTTSLLIEMPT